MISLRQKYPKRLPCNYLENSKLNSVLTYLGKNQLGSLLNYIFVRLTPLVTLVPFSLTNLIKKGGLTYATNLKLI